MMGIDKSSPIPLYYQLQRIVLEKIQSGEWPANAPIPSERELAEQFGITRMTIRHALTDLVRDGILRREMGKGTFVAEPRITQRLSKLTGFSDDMRARGRRPGARLLAAGVEPATPTVAERLRVPLGAVTVLIERLRLADGEAMAIESSHLSFAGCSELVREDLCGSLYALLLQSYGVTPTRARQRLSAGVGDRRESELLGIRRGAPVLRLERVTYDQNDRPFEYTQSTYRGDRYVFDAELVGLP